MTPRLGGTAPGPRFSAGRAEDPESALSLAMRPLAPGTWARAIRRAVDAVPSPVRRMVVNQLPPNVACTMPAKNAPSAKETPNISVAPYATPRASERRNPV